MMSNFFLLTCFAGDRGAISIMGLYPDSSDYEEWPAGVRTALDAVAIQAQAEYGSTIDHALKLRRYRKQIAAFRQEMGSRVERFDQRVSLGLPQYHEACELLRRYLRQESTAHELAEAINAHLKPVLWRVMVSHVNGHDNWTVDTGGAMDGWQELVLLAQEQASLWRFRICRGCDHLFYDASSRGDQQYCHRKTPDGKKPCQLRRKQTDQKRSRERRRGITP
jgi:hypothetical protein